MNASSLSITAAVREKRKRKEREKREIKKRKYNNVLKTKKAQYQIL